MLGDFTLLSLIETIRYQAARQLRHIHPASSPFLSGDTFRSLCDVVVDVRAATRGSNWLTKYLATALANRPQSSLRLFVELDLLSRNNDLNQLIEVLSEVPNRDRRRMILLFHNGDKTPNGAYYSRLVALDYTVFSVNVSHDMKDVSPLPIGLENRWHLRNGLVGPTKRASKKRTNPRSKMAFAAFNVSTNHEERSRASTACRDAGLSVYHERVSPRMHRQLLLDHRFVISPPGNGLDCHRTWEAIYLGCVPVVLKTTLPSELTENLPILAVDDWNTFLNLSAARQIDLFETIRRQPTEMAFLRYWKAKLK